MRSSLVSIPATCKVSPFTLHANATNSIIVYISRVSNRQTISLRGMRFHTLIGILPHEAELPQPVEIDLTVWRERNGSAELVDYRRLYEIAASGLAVGHGPYLEDVAESVAERALGLSGVDGVRVAVRKPHVALPGPLEYAEVVVERTTK
jgi:dihydroneopterin aldolase